MLVKDNEIDKYLDDYINDRIVKGFGIGCFLDEHHVFKKGNFNIILGHDGVGKTYFKAWHYLNLAVKYNLKFCIYTGENHAGQVVRDLIQMLAQRKFKTLAPSEIKTHRDFILQHIKFINNQQMYKFEDLLEIFGESEIDGAMIDPYTGLNRKFGHADNYEFLNKSREWVNFHGITLEVCTHPVSESERGANSRYAKGHMWEGSLKAPSKGDTEGGKPFANRCDDFVVVHRIADREDWKYTTMIFVEKVKDFETGGSRTMKDNPVLLEFNYGLGFKIRGINPLIEGYSTNQEPKPLPKSEFFKPVEKKDLRPTASNFNFDEDGFLVEPPDELPF